MNRQIEDLVKEADDFLSNHEKLIYILLQALDIEKEKFFNIAAALIIIKLGDNKFTHSQYNESEIKMTFDKVLNVYHQHNSHIGLSSNPSQRQLDIFHASIIAKINQLQISKELINILHFMFENKLIDEQIFLNLSVKMSLATYSEISVM